MEYSDIQTEITNISYMVAGTGFADCLSDVIKWQIYERFKQHIQNLPPDEYEEAIQHASDILEL